ncbi:MAG: dephospho-CoA kinase [Candidatus Omnitrophica bacterium]|nr:dephospho-CoA kinase [Candidatus Omnitrophota bacterium]
MKVIGVTGSYKSGKSTVSRMFWELGARIIDADKMGHEALLPQKETYERVVTVFGRGILDKSGRIDRKKLAAIVFSNAGRLNKLNKIIHPEVIGRIKNEIAEAKIEVPQPVIIVEAPLLYEAGITRMMSKIIVVDLSYERQIKRAFESGIGSQGEIKERISSQMPLDEKKRLADFIINNNGSMEETKRQVETIWKKIKE